MNTAIPRIRNDYAPKRCPACASVSSVDLGVLGYADEPTFAGRPLLLEQPAHLMSCRDCGSWHTAGAVRPSDAALLYARGSGDTHWHAQRFESAKTPEVVDAVRRLLQPGQCVVDVGCNTGELLDFCAEHGARTVGVELSERGVAACRAKGHAVVGDLRAVRGEADLVFAFDLVEHLYDLNSFVDEACSALRSGGKLVILTGDNSSLTARAMRSRWWYARYPEHVVFPSFRFWGSLRTLGYVERLRTFASSGYRVPIVRRWRTAAAALSGRGNGLPALDPDHHLLSFAR